MTISEQLELAKIKVLTLDLVLGQSALIVGDGDLSLDVGSLLLSGDSDDGVLVNVEGNDDDWLSSWSWLDALESESAEKVVGLDQRSLSLVDGDFELSLVVRFSGEGLALLGRDGGTSWDDLAHNSSDKLDTQGEWGHVDDDHVLGSDGGVSADDGSLHGGSVGDGLVWVDVLGWLLPVEVVLDQLLDFWDSGGTSDEDDFLDLGLLESGVLEGNSNWIEGLLEEILVEGLELGPSQLLAEVDSIEEVLNIDRNLVCGGEGSLGIFNLPLELLLGTLVRGGVLSGLSLEGLVHLVHHSLVEIGSSQVSVSRSGGDLEVTVINVQDGDIEGTTTEVVDQDVGVLAFLV